MRQYKIIILALLLLISLGKSGPAKAAPRANNPQTPAQIIALINAYRAEFGLPAYTQNSILMQTAQGQADYQSSIESVTHAGPDGSRPRDRAYAAGYGGGEIVFISEIIYGATSSGPDTAVNWWKTSQIHNDTMLASTYQEIGAGVASANGRNYYTAVTGYIAGGVYAPPSGSSESTNGEEFVAAPLIIPVMQATPQANGSIIHIIRTGQTLWTLSAIYKVSLADLLEINNMPQNVVIYPGDEIMIRRETSATSTSVPSATLVESETAIPRQTISPTSIVEAADTSHEESKAESVADAQNTNSSIQFTVTLALAAIATVVLATFFIKSPTSGPSDIDDQEEND